MRLLLAAWLLACCTATKVAGQTASVNTASGLAPGGIAYDVHGNLFVADTRVNQVLEVSLAGVTSLVAGTGEQGFSGDGGPATLALLNAPTAVAIDPDGTVYIADAGNQRIRAVTNGQIRTVVGAGAKGYSGDGADPLRARLNNPLALALDSSRALLIADSGNHRVRRVAGGTISTVAGSGIQGFSGDGGAATSAQLDTPAGLAATADGRMFIADSHNQRIRLVDATGTITTFAGTGARGFSGDGGSAVNALLFLPRGLAVSSTGALLLADSDNHRLRSIDAKGVITTMAGNGTQGAYIEAAASTSSSLDTPRSVTLSAFGDAVFGDSGNRNVGLVANDQSVYVAAPGAARPVSLSILSVAPLVYGEGELTVSVSGPAPTIRGTVTMGEGGVTLGTAAVGNGMAAIPISTLNAGQHAISASYSGDGLHATSVSASVTVPVAPRVVTATADPATMLYGALTPALTGTVNGVLARDGGNIAALFHGAPDLSPVGSYPISAVLTGTASGNYSVVMTSASGSLQITQATPVITLRTSQSAYAGMPITLTGTLQSPTRGTPTGTVNFMEGSTLVGTGIAANGLATATYVSPSAGSHTLTAEYIGDRNFTAARSDAVAISVGILPDFSLAVNGSNAQTVQGGSIATYSLAVFPQPAPFSGSVVFSVSGLPPGAKATFLPSAVVPGNSAASTTMTVQTVATASVTPGFRGWESVVFALGIPVVVLLRRRQLFARLAAVLLGFAMTTGATGCGARTIASPAGKTYPLTVRATSTNLLGAVVSHSVELSLTVQ